MLIIKNEIQKALYLHAEAAYPNECCGVILGRREGEQRIAHKAIPTENVSNKKRRETHFAMDPLQIAEIEMLAEHDGFEIVGFYHSHPNYEASASEEDGIYMLAGYSYPIVSVREGRGRQIACFEKSLSESNGIKEEKIMIQGGT